MIYLALSFSRRRGPASPGGVFVSGACCQTRRSRLRAGRSSNGMSVQPRCQIRRPDQGAPADFEKRESACPHFTVNERPADACAVRGIDD